MTPLRILVVEDDAMIAMLFTEMLEGLGHQVCGSVASEQEAVAAALALAPELMIVDERLRVGTGPGAMVEILTHGHVPHLFVTGNPVRVEQAMPGSIVIAKPFREAELVAGIARAMVQPAAKPAASRR